jgi:hypothetical protein
MFSASGKRESCSWTTSSSLTPPASPVNTIAQMVGTESRMPTFFTLFQQLWSNDTSTPNCLLPHPDHFLDALRHRSRLRRPLRSPTPPTNEHHPPPQYDLRSLPTPKVYACSEEGRVLRQRSTPSSSKLERRRRSKVFRCPSRRCSITLTPDGHPRGGSEWRKVVVVVVLWTEWLARMGLDTMSWLPIL